MAANSRSYGWVIVAAMLLIQTVSSGLGFYNMSVYITEFSKLLAVPVADVSLAVSLFFIAGGIAGMYVASLLQRFALRWVMVVGALLAGTSLSLVGFAESVLELYCLFVLFGIGNAGVSLVVATTLITQWFPGPSRSIALSTASTGLSLGGVLITPATAYAFNTYGTLETIPYLGVVFVALILPIALWVVRPAPKVEITEGSSRPAQWEYGSAVRSRFFLFLAAGYVLCMGAQVGGIAHLYSRVELIGGYSMAAMAVEVLAIASICGRLVGGVLVTRIPIRYFTLANLTLQGIGLSLIAVADSQSSALVAAACFGCSVGNLLMLQPLWLADAFPGSIYPKVFALANALSVLGVAFGPYAMGIAYDELDYTAAYYAAVGVSVVALFVVFSAGAGPRQESA